MATRLNIVALLMGLLIAGTVASKQNAAFFGLCNICVPFLHYEGLALKAVFQSGDTGNTCAELCGRLPEAANASCMGVCSFIGLQQLVGLVSMAQFKPLKSCISMKMCKFNEEASANFTSTNIDPTAADRGNKFSVQLTYTLNNEWPVGEMKYQIQDLDENVIDEDHLDYLVGKKPGDYKKSFSFKPKDKQYKANTDYNVVISLCNADCGIFSVTDATIKFHINNAKLASRSYVEIN